MIDKDKTIAILSRAVHSMAILMDESRGVVGLHQNGDVAPWGELLRGGRFESWLEDVSDAFDEINRLTTEGARLLDQAIIDTYEDGSTAFAEENERE